IVEHDLPIEPRRDGGKDALAHLRLHGIALDEEDEEEGEDDEDRHENEEGDPEQAQRVGGCGGGRRHAAKLGCVALRGKGFPTARGALNLDASRAPVGGFGGCLAGSPGGSCSPPSRSAHARRPRPRGRGGPTRARRGRRPARRRSPWTEPAGTAAAGPCTSSAKGRRCTPSRVATAWTWTNSWTGTRSPTPAPSRWGANSSSRRPGRLRAAPPPGR